MLETKLSDICQIKKVQKLNEMDLVKIKTNNHSKNEFKIKSN